MWQEMTRLEHDKFILTKPTLAKGEGKGITEVEPT